MEAKQFHPYLQVQGEMHRSAQTVICHQTNESLREDVAESDGKQVTTNEQQYGFTPGKCITDTLFELEVLADKYI